MGNDDLSVIISQSSIDELASVVPGKPWVSTLSGGPGNDILRAAKVATVSMQAPAAMWRTALAAMTASGATSSTVIRCSIRTYCLVGTGNDDLIGGSGSNHLFAWSQHPDVDPATGEPLDFIADGPSANFGVWVDSNGTRYSQPGNGRNLEDTGLNRMLGTSNPGYAIGDNPAVVGSSRYGDILYGGTGLDFLYGNGGGGVFGDLLVTRHGTPFGQGEDLLDSDGAWKEYAKSTSAAWYLAGSEGDDQVDINYVTNPYNPLFGRHQVTFSTTGSFDPRFSGFDSYSAFNRDDQQIHSSTDEVLLADNARTRPSAANPRDEEEKTLAQIESFGITSTDIVQTVFGGEADFLAIIIDSLGGNDTVTVGETVQKTVWVDAGAGDDTVQIEPQISFLPDNTDQVAPFVPGDVFFNPLRYRNDHPTLAIPLHLGTMDNLQVPRAAGSNQVQLAPTPLSTSAVFKDLTIDSARSDEPDVDWYVFQLNDRPLFGDLLSVTATSGISRVNLGFSLFSANNLTTPIVSRWTNPSGAGPQLPTGPIDLGLQSLLANQIYYLRVESVGAIPTEYEIAFALAHSIDAIPGNTSQTSAYRIDAIHHTDVLQGHTLATASDKDWFSFDLLEPSSGQSIAINSLSHTLNAQGNQTAVNLTVNLVDTTGSVTSATMINGAVHYGIAHQYISYRRRCSSGRLDWPVIYRQRRQRVASGYVCCHHQQAREAGRRAYTTNQWKYC